MLSLSNVVKGRFGGKQYCLLRDSLKVRKKLGKSTDPLVKAFARKYQYLLIKYFFGTNMSANARVEYQRRAYSTLCNIYTNSDDDRFFDFDGIIIPKAISAEYEGALCFAFQDLLFCNLSEYDLDFCEPFYVEGPYEIGNVYIENGDIVIDCGANMGFFSAIASHKGAIVYAFEPSETVINNYLSLTASKNPNIHVCKYALSNEIGELKFLLDNKTIGGSTLAITGLARDNSNLATVRSITLDSFVHDNNLSCVNFIKADIEGAERYMLKGAKQVLKDFAPKLAICSYHLPDDPKVLRELILDANPNYVVEEKFEKMYAHVPSNVKYS